MQSNKRFYLKRTSDSRQRLRRKQVCGVCSTLQIYSNGNWEFQSASNALGLGCLNAHAEIKA